MKEKAAHAPSLDEVVLTAAGFDGAERETYLCDVATADVDLAAHARRRLAAAEDLSDSFLDTPAAARLDGAAADSEEPWTSWSDRIPRTPTGRHDWPSLIC